MLFFSLNAIFHWMTITFSICIYYTFTPHVQFYTIWKLLWVIKLIWWRKHYCWVKKTLGRETHTHTRTCWYGYNRRFKWHSAEGIQSKTVCLCSSVTPLKNYINNARQLSLIARQKNCHTLHFHQITLHTAEVSSFHHTAEGWYPPKPQ